MSNICDFMSRKLNRNDLPYISILVPESNLKSRVATEGIDCSKRKESYSFTIRFNIQIPPGCIKEDIYTIFVYGFFDQHIVSPKYIDFLHAKYFETHSI